MKIKSIGITLISLVLSHSAFAISDQPVTYFPDKFSSNTSYTVCFTPGEACTEELVNVINHAQQTIFVQAYSFTSAPIAKAIVEAQRRGVDVKMLLDKSQVSTKYSSAVYFSNSNVPFWIDYKPAIAHNKVMIVDRHLTVTGSYNFTKAAQQKNAENMLIIDDVNLANKYLGNWQKRKSLSESYASDKAYKLSKHKRNKHKRHRY